MNTYELKEVAETTLPQQSTSYSQVPIDPLGNIPDYLNKDRVIHNGQMIVFDTRQEYLDYLEQNK